MTTTPDPQATVYAQTAPRPTTLWVVFAMTDNDHEAVGFRYHNGDLTLEVQHSIVKSLRDEDRKVTGRENANRIQRIVAWPLSTAKATTSGHHRWLPSGYEIYLYERGRGESRLGWWN